MPPPCLPRFRCFIIKSGASAILRHARVIRHFAVLSPAVYAELTLDFLMPPPPDARRGHALRDAAAAEMMSC